MLCFLCKLPNKFICMQYPIESLEAAAVQAAIEAGKAILEVYDRPDFTSLIEYKDDRSPLTLADKQSHIVLSKILQDSFPSIPILSEEGSEVLLEERTSWPYYWLVDPLDGTKEFIKRNGEFTVNIALMEHNRPVLGVIYIPVTSQLYVGIPKVKAYKIEQHKKTPLQVRVARAPRIAVGSRSHASPDEQAILTKYKIDETISTGSSIKFCLVAEGSADLYYRHGPTMEWDTAAGHAIVEAAGGTLTKIDGSLFPYNKENLLNSGFIVLGTL